MRAPCLTSGVGRHGHERLRHHDRGDDCDSDCGHGGDRPPSEALHPIALLGMLRSRVPVFLGGVYVGDLDSRAQESEMITDRSNHRAALDAASAFCLYSGAQCRRASEPGRYASARP